MGYIQYMYTGTLCHANTYLYTQMLVYIYLHTGRQRESYSQSVLTVYAGTYVSSCLYAHDCVNLHTNESSYKLEQIRTPHISSFSILDADFTAF